MEMRSIAQSLPHRLPAPTCAWIQVLLLASAGRRAHSWVRRLRAAISAVSLFEQLPAAGVWPRLQQLQGPTHLGRRSHRAMKFACHYAKGDYLVRVKKIARSGKYSFSTQSGTRFSLLSKDVPFQLLAEFASKQQPNVARECPVRPRVGEHVHFTAGT